jgi:hypothetical protein
VVREICRLHAAGFNGLGLNFVNYLAELPYFVEAVLPRLEQQGLRVPGLRQAPSLPLSSRSV